LKEKASTKKAGKYHEVNALDLLAFYDRVPFAVRIFKLAK
jgi:hypothetical protein